jgi:hypothetical protein
LIVETTSAQEKPGTNCLECEQYKKLGDVCVIEHGKKFLWEFCRDFEPEVKLPDYKELMSDVRKSLAIERKKKQEKKKREIRLRKKERHGKAVIAAKISPQPNDAQLPLSKRPEIRLALRAPKNPPQKNAALHSPRKHPIQKTS